MLKFIANNFVEELLNNQLQLAGIQFIIITRLDPSNFLPVAFTSFGEKPFS